MKTSKGGQGVSKLCPLPVINCMICMGVADTSDQESV